MHNRNDPCWCGSGQKYKKCHMKLDEQKQILNQPPPSVQKIHRSPEFVQGMRDVCKLAAVTLQEAGKMAKAGVTTNQINDFVHQYTLDHGARPAPLNYHGFPKSVCTSVNEVICHGIPSDYMLKDGDIVNIDVTSILGGYFGDTNATFFVGEVSPEAKRITAIAKHCLQLGIEAVRPYGHMGDIGAAIQEYAHGEKCTVVEQFVGHGIGRVFHDEPQVPHFGRKGTGVTLIPGMFFTIEPMINLGKKGVKVLEDGWTAITIDRELTAQFEHTIYVTDTGVEVLTV